MWNQADRNEMVLLPITMYGWSLVEGKLTVVWDSEVNIAAVKERVCMLTKGCKCKTGCATKRCSCRKNGNQCSAGCQCINCVNIMSTNSSTIDSEDLQDMDDLMDYVFGTEPGVCDMDASLDRYFSDSESELTTDMGRE